MLENVERYDNIITYQRKLKKMSGTSDQDQGNSWERVKEVIKIAGEIFAVLGVVIGIVIYIITNFEKHSNEIENLQNDVKEMKENYNNTFIQIDNLTDLVENDHEIFLELAAVDAEESPYNILFKDAYRVKTEEVKNEEYLAAPIWSEGQIIASDINGDIIYNPEDLYNKPIITSYLDGDNEVYFYGRFNENNNWNGKCILNIYNGNKLVSIFEGVYDDGELFSYNTVSIIQDDENNNESIWLINNRTRQGEYNSGETLKYTKTKEFTKDFTLEDVKEKQILTCDKFLSSRDEKLLGYYKGNTVNGKYNDDSGNAYLVKYKADGDVRYLYKGKVKNGEANDNSGNAWELSWGYANDGYHYHEGEFKDGNPINTSKDWAKPVTQEFIDSKVNPDNYNCPLTGLIGSDS